MVSFKCLYFIFLRFEMKSSHEIEIFEHTNEILVFNGKKRIRIKLEHQLMQILKLMMEHTGGLVEKNLFINRIWDGNHYTGEPALTKNIFKLREILKSNKIEDAIRIETIPKKGYRLLIGDGSEPDKSNRRFHKMGMIIPGITIVLLGVCYFLFHSGRLNGKYRTTVTIVGNDTIIQPANKKAVIINLDTGGKKLTSAKK